MSEKARDLRKEPKDLNPAKRIHAFVEDHPLLSLAFMVAAGYAVGRIISKL
jgi:hypothetical protein